MISPPHLGDISLRFTSLGDGAIAGDAGSIYVSPPPRLWLQWASLRVCGVVLDIHRNTAGEKDKGTRRTPDQLSEGGAPGELERL